MPDRWALDIGANVGSYSLLLAELVGPEHLVCLEPIPDLRRRLQRLLPSARVLPKAASSSRGRATLRVPVIGGDATPSRATLEAGVREEQQTGASEIVVETITIDEVVGALGDASVGFIKIDVEGHEREALRGATRTLKEHRPTLLVEVEQRHHGYPITEIFAEVEGQGFTGCFVDVRARAVSALEGFDVSRRQAPSNHGSRDYIANFLFFPVERAQETRAAVERLLREKQLALN